MWDFGFRVLSVSIIDEVIYKRLPHRRSGALLVSDQKEMTGKREILDSDLTELPKMQFIGDGTA